MEVPFTDEVTTTFENPPAKVVSSGALLDGPSYLRGSQSHKLPMTLQGYMRKGSQHPSELEYRRKSCIIPLGTGFCGIITHPQLAPF